jgi:putative FmdB family regulatory protein
MPTYEYRCPNGHEFEKFQRMSEPPAAQCPACGKEASRLLSGGAGLLFKGDGFYITDYRSDSYRKAAASENPAAKGGGEKGSGKSDAAPSSGKSGSDAGSGKTGTGGSKATPPKGGE